MRQSLQALTFLLLSAPAFAGVDLAHVPPAFCKSALEVAQETTSCSANSTFILESQACLDKLNRLEAELGREAHQIAQGGEAAQLGKVRAGSSEYEFSSGAMTYLRATAMLAAQELEEYPWQIFLPPDLGSPPSVSEIQEAALGGDCYSEPFRRVNQARAEFDRKIATYTARIAEATKLRSKLRGISQDLEAQGAAAASSRGTGSGLPKARPAGGASDISGVQQDLDKQKK